jgi:hypothetical protein
LFKDATTTPSLVVLAAILLPLIVLAIVRGLPVKSLSSDKEKEEELPTSNYLPRTAVICSLIYTVAILLLLCICCSNFIN